jgi:hypothetical protein
VLAMQSTNMPAIGLGVLKSPRKQFPCLPTFDGSDVLVARKPWMRQIADK